ncbi:MAG TPA: L,D-transpeptidase family protein [Myxococcota bacterium]|jgi:L,D-transpeptidase ErfK/SrfK|nr:L,D-transpeptidase family protein [Myxococcota bacterium]
MASPRLRTIALLLAIVLLPVAPHAAPAKAAGSTAATLSAPLPPLIGDEESALIEPEDTVLDVAYGHRLGFDNVARANPGVPVWIPEPGTVVRLPTREIVPEVPPRGLVINIPEMRLYDFTRRGPPEVFAIAIGDEIDPSLHGAFRIGRKRENPAWHVPKAIREEKPDLPAVVPPGPDNPLGDRWMTIGTTSYGIHGTNNNWSIGRTATHGCIRLYNDEMRRLYDHVPSGTPLEIVYEPVKLGADGDAIYVEAHPDVYGRVADLLAAPLAELDARGLTPYVDLDALRQVVEEAKGVPVRIGTLPPSSEAAVR